MVVEGAMRAGCRFFSGYPITPASEIYREATLRLQARGDVAVTTLSLHLSIKDVS